MTLLLAVSAALAADAGLLELEIRQGLRSQHVSALVSPGVLGFQDTFGVSAEGRFRLSRSDRRFGVELQGAGDWLTWAAGFRPERWGGIQGLVGFGGRTPLTTTWVTAGLGIRTMDVRHLAEETHTPRSAGLVSLEVRRFAQLRLQELEGELFAGDGIVGGTVRTTFGFAIGDTGWFATFGASTQRVQDLPGGNRRELVMVTHQAETSMVLAPNVHRVKRR